MKSTFLKVMSILLLIFGIIGAIGSALAVVTVNAFGSFGISLPVGSYVVAIIQAILMIVAGAYGLGASKDPAKAKTAVIFGIILIALAVISIIMGVVASNAVVAQLQEMMDAVDSSVTVPNIGLSWTNFTGLIMPVLYFLAAFLFKKKANA